MKIIDGKPEYRGAVVRFNLQVIFTILYGYFLICGVHITTSDLRRLYDPRFRFQRA